MVVGDMSWASLNELDDTSSDEALYEVRKKKGQCSAAPLEPQAKDETKPPEESTDPAAAALRTRVKNPLYSPPPAASPSPKRPAVPLALGVEDETVPLVDLEEEATATSAPLESDDLTAKDDANNSKTN
jgi:hypothetical protein